ncbi:peroxide stress protein YaaA [Tissierella pigra]|uniref:UPF0246 protein FYJ83_13105 n=1 Tax=Tissierella pigra TaxID=2607614 RepID=A0A6N7Y1N1_9FIRM|nr:peroxide stress protein YaaA [Tissierella pigra]MBU5427005.1 peroxide stress protein YaaA [Tissierella pigra]MSU02398.1 peroxide stress protein YaaA [Tissierella pigra]
MRIIISPAKKMKVDSDDLGHRHIPEFIKDAEILLTYLRELDYKEVKSIWKCSDKIAELNYNRIRNMDLYRNLTPAILSYEGIQYQYMAPGVFEEEELEYIDEHLRILSGFYGILRPFDGVVPYRLEMQAKPIDWHFNSLYEFWGHKLAKNLFSESQYIVNLASKEYSKCISNYLDENVKFITCVFGELINGKVVEKGTFAKMARGEMVRFMTEKRIKDMKDIKRFDRLGYIFNHKLSNENTYVFIKNNSER